MSDAPAAMDLDEFVKSTILQIMRGVHAASLEAPSIDDSAVVNPRDTEAKSARSQSIEFDVAVTVTGRSFGEAGAKIKVFSMIEAGAKGQEGHDRETASRVRFEVPVRLPSTAHLTRPKPARRVSKSPYLS